MGINFDIITVFHEASITDWIQAIAAIIAVPGAIAAFIVLFRRDEQKDAMIAELKTQAAESIKQSGHLADQVTHLSGQVFQLERIHEAIAEGIRIMAKSEELNLNVHKIKIRPHFDFEFSMFKPGHLEAEIHLLNRGAVARNFSAHILKGDDAQIKMADMVPTGEHLNIRLRSSRKMNDHHPHIELQFDDEEGTRYAQRILLDPTGFKVTLPKLVEPR